jgi:amino acid adenylation domain-containing protein
MTLESRMNGRIQSSVNDDSFGPQFHEPIAIIGIGCRFPGGNNSPDVFWEGLEKGIDAINEVPASRWNLKSFHDREHGKPGKSHACRGGFIEGIDQFDPHFFGISPREAARMDPQQRLLLEVAWEALEDGGQVLSQLSGTRTSVFVGISSWDYSVLQTSFRDRGTIDAYTNTGGTLSIAANRISYCFNFRGPSSAIDTACSSALVAVHLACRSIWVDRAPLALAGGVNALLTPDWYVGFSRMGMLSPDGRCKAFDARANGFVRSEGAGMVVLKPMAKAIADGDRIYALIRGTAVNQDGRTEGMTVPNQESQEDLLRQACRNAGVSPLAIQYIEAHGTGTPVGDPIEAKAIGNIVGAGRSLDSACILGSVKTNIGHLEAGSGIAGLIKTALALHHQRIPGNLHFEQPNPDIDFQQLRVRVPTKSEPWPLNNGLALAGVNSFGFGGTNAHVVLQGASAERYVAKRGEYEPGGNCSSVIIPLSARSPEALNAAATDLSKFLTDTSNDVSLHDIAVNAAERRSHHNYRLALVAHSKEELLKELAAFAKEEPSARTVSGRVLTGQNPHLAFVCSGQGPQWWGMGRQLLSEEPAFRSTIERCDAIVKSLGPWSLLEELTAEESQSRMTETAISQPAIFAIQVALAALWDSWSVRPEAVVGHSVGEVAAAYLAGIFDLEDAVRVIYHRGRCMDRASSFGRMLAVGMSGDEVGRLLEKRDRRISIAAINSPGSTTLSGDAESLEEIAGLLREHNIFSRFLQVNYAFHSAQMDPVREELLRSLKGINPKRAKLPFFSTVSGKRVRGNELKPEYWWQNVRQTVRFADGVDRLIQHGCDTVVELSPHPVLTAAVSECYQRCGKKVVALPSLRRKEDERAIMLRTAAELHVHGYSLDWLNVMPGPRRFVRLPTYPWQRQRYWSESEESLATRLSAPTHPLLGIARNSPRPLWEVRLDLRQTLYLAEHRVQGVTILPATAYLECSFAIARERYDKEACQLEEVKLINPCFPADDKALWLQTTYSPEDSTVRIDSRPTGTDQRDWTAHFQAVLRDFKPTESADIFDSVLVRNHCPRSFSREECYNYFTKLGLDYGPRFQGIERCWQGKHEALGEVSCNGIWSEADDEYIFHPVLLDSCFQVVIAADPEFNREVGDLYLPVGIDRVRLYHRAGGQLWSHARLREKTAFHTVADIDIYDENGQSVATIHGLRSQRVTKAGRQTLNDLLYEYKWVEKPHVEQLLSSDAASPKGTWLIFSDAGGVGNRLATNLQSGCDECYLVVAGNEFASLGEDRWQIDPTNRDDMHRLLRTASTRSTVPFRGIIYLWSLDTQSSETLQSSDLMAIQDRLLMGLTHLVQTWESPSGNPSARLFLITRGAQRVTERETMEVAQAPLIGLGRVVINEFASLQTKLVDLDSQRELGDIDSLINELFAEDDEDEIALRGSQRFVHRFIGSTAEEPVIGSLRSGTPYRLSTIRPGTIDGLKLQAMHRLAPGPGEIEIEVRAAGLNFSDVMKALGIYPGLTAGPVPFGAECSGSITAIGDNVEEFAIGDDVIAVAPFSFASHVITRSDFVVRKPAHLSFEAAATIPIAFLTADYALSRLAHLEAGERVLIHSATGGVGLAAIQIARRSGAEIFATAGNAEKRQFLADLGIEHVMDSRTLAFADEVLRLTGDRGVDVVLNSLAGEAIAKGLSTLAESGRFLEIGKRDIYQNTRIGLQPFQKNLSFIAIDLDRVMRERPALLGKLLRRIVVEIGDRNLEPLPHHTFPVGDVAEAFRFMQQGKHIGKIVISMAEQPVEIIAGNEPVAFQADASYLIAGGLGGFGLETARWLAQRGARSLILVSRRGKANDEDRQSIAEMEGLGVRVTIAKADVACEKDVSCLLATIARDLPPLRGIFHAAMVLEDCLLQNLDRDRMQRVLAPKVRGAWNLHKQTQHLPLDYFVLFSSLSSVFGHPGQGNYAAANAFLDSLAWHRRSRGLPCLTINWGHLGEVGYLARRQELSDRLTRQGILPFSVGEAMKLLERAIQRQSTQISVMRVDWSRWKGLSVTGRVSPRFADLMQMASASQNDNAHNTSLRTKVRSASTDERPTVLTTILCDKLARVLGTKANETDWETSLLQLGLDSLMAVEIANWIQAELGVALPVVELMRSPGVYSLTQLVLAKLTDGDRPNEEGPLRESATGLDMFPLSHGQRALGFLHQMNPSSPALNLSFCARIVSPIDKNAYRQAFQSLIDRHAGLRTTFVERDGELMQRIHDRCDVAFAFIDASEYEEETLHQRIQEELEKPFNLEKGPLLRMYLFARSPRDHLFIFTAHHIIGDFWSLVVLIEEMRIAYPAALAGVPPVFPPLSGDYQQFVRWQSGRLAGSEGERLWAWWKKHLDGVPHVLNFPTDRKRPPRFTHRGGGVPCQLDVELTGRLKEVAGKEEATLFVSLLAAFQVLISRYSGQDDFVVGSPFAGRPRREFEGVVGYFINMLPLRARLDPDMSFRSLIQRVKATVYDAFEYQDYPFSQIVDRLGIERDPSRTPLIQASFTLERSHRKGEIGTSRFLLPQAQFRMEIGGMQTEPYPMEQRICQADLEMVLEENEGKVEGMLCYNTDLFDKRTTERIAGLYANLLAELVANPDTPLSQIPWLTERERTRILEEWNDTRLDGCVDSCLHELFAKQVAETPDSIAIRFQQRIVNYRELDDWANRIAREIHRHGVEPGALVALCFDRSPEMIAAILGVMKAGAAYVPFDTDSPDERLRHILNETRSPILLTQHRYSERLSALARNILCIDSDHFIESCDDAPPPPSTEVGTGDLAYLIYTSGSTGRPKGVMVEHGAIVNTVRWRQHTLPLSPNDRVLLSLPYHFDASVAVIFHTLLSGSQLVLAKPGEERNPARLLSRIAQDGVTLLQCLPGTLQFLLEEPEFQTSCRTLVRVCCGGEPMQPQLPRRLFALLKAELYNLYGPTETAVEATSWKCGSGNEDSVVPIGRPIGNVCVYVLDEQRRPVPVGVPGELYIGGAGLARGYFGDSDLTVIRFVADLFVEKPDARMFKTGDRVRWRADGALEMIGRIDRQVKISGYRIEPCEIETALLSHPLVKDAIVTVRDDSNITPRLVAYTVPSQDGIALSKESLQRHLEGLLPRHMVPADIVLLSAFPRTGSGKVDLKALPLLNSKRVNTNCSVAGPRSRLEAFLAEVWSDLLNGENIDINDNFFDLGGNSLQALMLMGRIRDKLGERVATSTVFDSPTIIGLAKRLRSSHSEAVNLLFGPEDFCEESSEPAYRRNGHAHINGKGRAVDRIESSDLLVALQPIGTGPPLFLVHPPGGIVACYQTLAALLGQDRPVYGIRSRGLYREEILPSRLEDLAAEYVDAIRTVQPEGPYLLGGWSLGGVFVYEMAQQLLENGESIELLALLDSTLPFGPTNSAYLEGIDQSGWEFGLDLTLEELGLLGPDEQLPFLWHHVKQLGLVDEGVPLTMAQEIIDDLKRLFHTHVKLVSEYTIRPLSAHITLFRPSDSPVAANPPLDRGWSQLADVEVRFVPGQHHTMVKEPHVRHLARELLDILEGIAIA